MSTPALNYQPNFFLVAQKFVELGAYVVPVEPNGKRCLLEGWQDKATRDLQQILTWSSQNPNYNVGIVGKPEIGAVWGFDDDGGVLGEYEAQHGTIQTYRTKTVSGGTHLLFKANAASIAMGNLTANDENGKELFSARIDDRYVLSAGSVAHPHNDQTQPLAAYNAVDKTLPIEAPNSFIEWLKQRAKSAKQKAKTETAETAETAEAVEVETVVEGGRNTTLTSIAGKARQNLKMDKEQLHQFLSSKNQEICKPPLPESEVRTIADSVGGYPIVETGGLNFFKPQPTPELRIIVPPYPNFPNWVFTGIPAYDNWVKPLCEINSRYEEYMMLPTMVLIMNYLSTKGVRIGSLGSFPLSFYLLLVGRKGRVIKSSSAQDAMTFCELLGILSHGNVKNAEGKSLVFTVGSTEGLGLEMARTNCQNAVMFFDEFSKTIAKMGIENSSFANDLSTMYESGKFENKATSRKQHFSFAPMTYCTSFIGCTTDKRYPRLASKLFSSVDGMDERFFVLYQPEILKEVTPIEPFSIPGTAVQETKKAIENAMNHGDYSIEDKTPLHAISKLGNRIEIRAEKWALAFAVLLGRDSVDEDCVDRGIALSKYEHAIKRYLAVGESISREGGLQRELRMIVERAGGSMKLRDLQRKVSYDNFGTELWYRVYGGLVRSGIFTETGKGVHGDPTIVHVSQALLTDEDDS